MAKWLNERQRERREHQKTRQVHIVVFCGHGLVSVLDHLHVDVLSTGVVLLSVLGIALWIHFRGEP